MRRQARWAQVGRLVQDLQICNWRVMWNVVYAMHNEGAIWSSYEWMKSLTCKVAATCVYALPHSHSTKSLASTFAFFSVHRCLCYMQLLFLPPLHPHWLQLPDGGCEWGLQLCLHADKWYSCTCTGFVSHYYYYSDSQWVAYLDSQRHWWLSLKLVQ